MRQLIKYVNVKITALVITTFKNKVWSRKNMTSKYKELHKQYCGSSETFHKINSLQMPFVKVIPGRCRCFPGRCRCFPERCRCFPEDFIKLFGAAFDVCFCFWNNRSYLCFLVTYADKFQVISRQNINGYL